MSKTSRFLVMTGAVLLAACSAEDRDAPELVSSDVQALRDTRGLPLRVDDLFLQLPASGSGALSLKLAERERARVLADNGRASFALALSAREPSVEFNDLGRGLDARAGDGLFTGAVSVNVELLTQLNREVSRLDLREPTVRRFVPGSRVVSGSERIATTSAIDLEALRRGATVRLPHIDELGPLRTLGAVTTASINPQKSLLIRSLPVIEDPARTMNPCNAAASNSPLKRWTFGHLMEQMAQGSGLSPSDFVQQWLNAWRTQQSVTATGGAPVLDATSTAAADSVDSLILNPWKQRSGGGTLDLSIAPFRLQAIVYRSDLAQSSPYGGSSAGNSGGELRFVFGAMEVRDANGDGDANDAGDTCQPIEMSTIFEFGVPLSSCTDIKDWANAWVNLSTLLPGTPAYGAALEALTEAVVVRGAAPAKPNQSALNQLRTNEIDLTGIWQFREFVLPAAGGPLTQTTTKNNPREHQVSFTSVLGVTPSPIDMNGSPALLTEILKSMGDPSYQVPELSGGAPFLGGASSYNFDTFWDHPDLLNTAELEARFTFSSKTCSGCHTGETATSFYHIRPAGPGASPTLSGFLQSGPLTVTDVRGLSHTFAEMDNRKQALASLANQICGFKIGLPPLQLTRVPLASTH
ncbi:hypothetical protein BE17_53205 [Sorangium cellulosum]|uniref:Uncharacterized protein n=1 Tax=Sorangium cellulosum TaxID=56 RepID=A0A150SLU6_SORCE|nr:hypothetical protein BE17_53205 [Sorangium cellulosum]